MSAIDSGNSMKLSTSQKTMIAGGIAGSVAKTITAPLSRLTVLYQVSPILSCPEGKSPLSINANDSIWKTSRNILKKEGVLAFWKGNFTSVIHRFPYSAVNFYSYEIARAFVHKTFKSKDTPLIRFVCGGFSGMMACGACYPLELIRTRMTVMDTFSSSREAAGFVGPSNSTSSVVPRLQQSKIYRIVSEILAQDGVLGLYRGLSVSLCVAMPTLAIGFSVYGHMKQTLLEKGGIFKGQNGHLSAYGALLSGCVSGITSSVIMFPTDVLRKRMQVMNDKLAPVFSKSAKSSLEVTQSNSLITASTVGDKLNIKYSTTTTINASMPIRGSSARWVIFNHYKNILATEGLRGMYRGLVPELMKVCPMVAITFCTYELTSDFLNAKFPTLTVLQDE